MVPDSQRLPFPTGGSPASQGALAWASLAQRFPASSVLAREGAGCGSVGDVSGAWLASAPLSPEFDSLGREDPLEKG